MAILDPQTLELHGEFGGDHQSGTHDIDFDMRGNPYLADTHNNRVLIYAVDGLETRRLGQLEERIRGPEGVRVHPNGRIYVAGAWSGKGANRFTPPEGVEIMGSSLWLSDSGNDRIVKYRISE